LLRHARREGGNRGIWFSARLFHEPAHGRTGDAVLLCDLRQRHAGAAVSDDLFTIDIKPSTPDLTPFCTGASHATADTLY
jgi:hypothetical protein